MQTINELSQELLAATAAELAEVGTDFHAKNWSLATSSNYSAVLRQDPLLLLMTSSGKDKAKLAVADFVVVNADGEIDHPVVEGKDWAHRPSAETLLHIAIAAMPGVGAVLHTHSVWSTILSDMHFAAGRLEIEGYEMLKALNGITTHDTRLVLPIFENTQDIAWLASQVTMEISPRHHGFLIRKHGLYTWGGSIQEAKRHVEALEFLFEVVARSGGAQ